MKEEILKKYYEAGNTIPYEASVLKHLYEEIAFKAMEEYAASQSPAPQLQICPKCNGQGTVSKPPWIPGDINEWSSSSTIFQCNVCNGNKVLYTSPAPQREGKLEQAVKYLLKKYEIYHSNVQWHIKVNTPKDDDLDRIQQRENDFAEMITDLRSLLDTSKTGEQGRSNEEDLEPSKTTI